MNTIHVPYVGQLVKHYHTDAGWDLKVESVEYDAKNKVWIVNTGVRLAPESNDLWFLVAPRSSLYKLGYFMVNSIGVIDPEYRGEIKVILAKFRDDVEPLEKGMRIAQLIPIPKQSVVFLSSSPMTFEEKMQSSRGTNGLGSTGKK